MDPWLMRKERSIKDLIRFIDLCVENRIDEFKIEKFAKENRRSANVFNDKANQSDMHYYNHVYPGSCGDGTVVYISSSTDDLQVSKSTYGNLFSTGAIYCAKIGIHTTGVCYSFCNALSEIKKLLVQDLEDLNVLIIHES